MARKEKIKLYSRYIAYLGVRNSELENLHCGTYPGTKDEYKDVKVVSPFGEIPYPELSRISDAEMRVLMLGIEKKIEDLLSFILYLESVDDDESVQFASGKTVTKKYLLKTIKKFCKEEVSYDLPANMRRI